MPVPMANAAPPASAAGGQIEQDQTTRDVLLRDPVRQPQAQRAANRRNQQRLGQHEAQHEPIGEPDRLEHRQLARALPDGDSHRVARDEQQREEDDAANRQQQELDVAHLLDEPRRERRLGLRARLGRGVAELRVDRRATANAWSGFATRTMYHPTIPCQ